MAFSAPELLLRTLQRGLPKLAPRTITMPRMWIRAVDQTRQSHVGFAVEEMTRDASSVASPVLAGDGTLIAAVALVVRASADLERPAPAVRTTALALARELERTR